MSKIKKILLRTLIFFSSLLLLAIINIVVIYFLYKHYYEQTIILPADDVVQVNDYASGFYLVKCRDGYIAVDAGFDKEIIKKALAELGVNPGMVKALLLTHSDFDHIGGIKVLKPDKIYISRTEEKLLSALKQRFVFLPFYSNRLDEKKMCLLNDNDSLEISGRKIKCISLPGHTSGSMGYIIDGKYLFTGDAVRLKNGRLSAPYKKALSMDYRNLLVSLEKIRLLKGITHIFTANTGFSDFNYAIRK